MKSYRHKEVLLHITYSVIPAVAITGFLWLTSSNAVTLVEVGAAFFLVLIPWHCYRNWRRLHHEELPFFAMIAFMYWLYYALQLFWGELTVGLVARELDPDRIQDALFMAVLGVVCIWLGMKSRLGNLITPHRLPQLIIDPTRWNYVRGILIFSSIIGVIEPSTYLFGEGGRQAFGIFLWLIPLFSFALLFRRYLSKNATIVDKLLIAGFLITRSITGLSSGWLGSFATLIIVCGAIYAAERRRIPRFALVTVITCILFFQVGKQDFRQTYWAEETRAGQAERVTFWVNSSLEKWNEALTDSSGESLKDILGSTLSRVGLLAQTADVVDQTPSIVPYQHGRLYSYMLYTWIPRAIWSDKPSVNEANQFYQVAYGVTPEENLDKVSIAVGVLTEAYMNFGWYGVVLIMFFLGVFLDFYRRFFFSESSGLVLSSMGMVLLPQMLAIDTQMAQYLGGISQQVLFSLLVFLPAVRWIRTQRIPNVSRLQAEFPSRAAASALGR
jgi:hypothetical protein